MQDQKINKRNISIRRLLPFTPKVFISLFVILLPATFLLQQGNLFNTNISQLNPASMESKIIDADLRQALGVGEVNHIFLTSDKDFDVVLKRTQEVQQELKSLIDKNIISGSIGVNTLLPSKEVQQYRLDNLPSKQTLENNVLMAIEGLPFKKKAFDVFINDVVSSKTMPLLDYQNFKMSIMEGKLQSLLFIQNNVWYSLIRVVDIKDINIFNKQVNNSNTLRDSYYSISAEASSIMNSYLKETWVRLLAMLLLLLASILWFSYTDKSRVWIVIPVFSGVLISLSFQVLLGNSINIFHLLSLLLVVGLGFDYSLFFNHENEKVSRNGPSNSEHAIIISAATTIITFSILAFSSVSILSSIGQIVIVGVFACFVIAKFISTPTLTTTSKA